MKCSECEDCLRTIGPNGGSYRCYGQTGVCELKKTIGAELPETSPEWCPKKRGAHVMDLISKEQMSNATENKKLRKRIDVYIDIAGELKAENAEYRRCLEVLLSDAGHTLRPAIKAAIGLEYLERFSEQIRARDAVIEAARGFIDCEEVFDDDCVCGCGYYELCKPLKDYDEAVKG